jgi:hypothetical protein
MMPAGCSLRHTRSICLARPACGAVVAAPPGRTYQRGTLRSEFPLGLPLSAFFGLDEDRTNQVQRLILPSERPGPSFNTHSSSAVRAA